MVVGPEEEVWERMIYTWLVRSTGDNLDLHLVSEVSGVGQHSNEIESFILWIGC